MPRIRYAESSIYYSPKFSEKLTFLTPWYAHVHTCAYQGVRNVSFSENFAYVLNGWPQSKILKFAAENILKKKTDRSKLLKLQISKAILGRDMLGRFLCLSVRKNIDLNIIFQYLLLPYVWYIQMNHYVKVRSHQLLIFWKKK